MSPADRQAAVDLAVLLLHLARDTWARDELAALLRRHRGLRQARRSRVDALGRAMGATPDRWRTEWSAPVLPAGLLRVCLDVARPAPVADVPIWERTWWLASRERAAWLASPVVQRVRGGR